jgi:hypothetical protein
MGLYSSLFSSSDTYLPVLAKFMVLVQPCRSKMWYTGSLLIFRAYLILRGNRFHAMTIYPEIARVLIEHIHITDEITLVESTTSPIASCSSCGTLSSQVQSRYTRKLHDLPSGGGSCPPDPVGASLFCQNRTCSKRCSPNGCFNCVIPTLNGPSACKKRSANQSLRCSARSSNDASWRQR